MGSYSYKTLKTLFGRATGCAFPTCTAPIVDEVSNVVVCEICHIRSRKLTGARYSAEQTDAERNDYENLIIMCSLHHKIIDEDVTSYSVERLNVIKAEHEVKVLASLENPKEKQDFLQQLDDRIRLIIEHEKVLEDDDNEVKEPSGSSALARKLAEKSRHTQTKGQWRAFHEGLQQAIESVNEILKKVETRYEQEVENLRSLQIFVHKAKGFRSIFDKNFISKIKLEGFSESHYGYIPEDFRLELQLYLKTSNPFDSNRPYTKLLESERLLPDLSPTGDVMWSDTNSSSMSSDEIVERMFEQLLKQVEKGRPVDEDVDEFGNSTDDEDDSPFEDGW
jgi:hypothetical protein